MDHIVNTKRLAELGSQSKVSSNHQHVLYALAEVFPSMPIEYVGMEGGLGDLEKPLLDEQYSVITKFGEEWLGQTLEDVGLDPSALSQKLSGGRLFTGSQTINDLYFSDRIGPDPEDFYQVKVIEYTSINIWGCISCDSETIAHVKSLEELRRLIDKLPECEQEVIRNPSYQLCGVINIRQYMLQKRNAAGLNFIEFSTNSSVFDIWPNFEYWSDEVQSMPEQRFFDDWKSSSVSQHNPEKNWFFEYKYDRDVKEPNLSAALFPFDELTVVDYDREKTITEIMKELEEFDKQAGYPFAWYFFMVHGGLIDPRIGMIVNAHLNAGAVHLPVLDAVVLRRWSEQPYRM